MALPRLGCATYHHREFPAERIAVERRQSVTVCVPTRDEAETIGAIVRVLVELRERGVLDQVLVADHSADDTPRIAADLGAEVVRTDAVRTDLGPVVGKGDNLWRALGAVRGDILCLVDGDSADFRPHFVTGLVGPLVCVPGTGYVKGFYRRPWRGDEGVRPTGGGRVTQLLARPLLRRFYPDLLAFDQPLAGEMAAPRALFESVPFAPGYGLETGLLIDVYRKVGIGAMCQVDLETRQNRHRPLEELAPMADSIVDALTARLAVEGRVSDAPPVRLERPPYADVRTAA